MDINIKLSLVHAGEYVFPQHAVKAIGLSNLEALAKGGLPQLPKVQHFNQSQKSSNIFNFSINVEKDDTGLVEQIKNVVMESVEDIVDNRRFKEGVNNFMNLQQRNKYYKV
ncbi:hypothetical protein [Bartonella sp. DGB1]|uniref:hypothetical protein n=1 Tax=Bartonella sp. DGB1 TaxID=3239807 RepID=UPI003525B955